MRDESKIEIAEMAYLEAVGTIKRMMDVMRGSKKFDTGFSNTLKYFESALQGVLLYAELEIGALSEATKGFIEGNTITGNFLDVANGIGLRKLYRAWERLNWDNVCKTNVAPDRLKEIFREAIGTCVQNFIFPMADFDADITTTHYSDIISQCVRRILHAVCSPSENDIAAILPPDMQPDGIEAQMYIAEKTLDAIDAGIGIFNDAFLVYWKGSNPLS